ncbi:MAG: Gfo/Idh/MocA family oxidoreductase [Verrucomicrobia bacterium]|nr:Gfo/Idh/MocA family oxidoreductase [Verrucomicrobiota bacterium]
MKPTDLTRRRFLAHAATAAVAPLILPGGLRGQNAPSNQVRLAAIGCGSRGRSNLMSDFAGKLDDARVVVTCDCFRQRREQVAGLINQAHGQTVCEAVGDFRDVLARSDIDGVVISTQDHWHVPLTYAAALAGKDVYVEKPLSLALTWSQKLRALVAQKKTVVQYGTQQRGSMHQFRRACELVRNGYLGEIQEVLAWCPDMGSQLRQASQPYGSNEPLPPPPDFDYDMWIGPAPMQPYTADRCTKYGGYHIHDYALGFIAGWGAHPIDIVHWALDCDRSGPSRLEGSGILPPAGSLWDTIESWDMRLDYPNNVRVRFMGGRIAEPVIRARRRFYREEGVLFAGSKGWLSVDRTALYTSDRNLQNHEVGENEIRLTRTASHARNFIDCVRSRQAPISPLEAAIRSDTVSLLTDIAIRGGRAVRWDPVTETISGDDEAARMLDRPVRAKWDVLAGHTARPAAKAG